MIFWKTILNNRSSKEDQTISENLVFQNPATEFIHLGENKLVMVNKIAQKIDISDLSSGHYKLIILDNNNSKVEFKKFIKK